MLELDPKTTALVMIDVQKGTLGMPLAPYDARHIIETNVALAQKFTDVGALVIQIRVTFAPGYVDRVAHPTDVPMAVPPGGLPEGYDEIAPEVAAIPGQIQIVKRQWGAFYGTDMDLHLRRRGISTIVLTGIATNFGVESTARAAFEHNYGVVVVEDACSSVGDLHGFTIEKVLPRIARIRKSAEVIAALR